MAISVQVLIVSLAFFERTTQHGMVDVVIVSDSETHVGTEAGSNAPIRPAREQTSSLRKRVQMLIFYP